MVFVQARVVDFTHLELAEPISAGQGERVIVSMADFQGDDAEKEMWLSISAEGLARAYGDTEPDYSLAVVKEPNTKYRSPEDTL